MITDLEVNNRILYSKAFKKEPERFARKLSNTEIRLYGIKNSDFWRNFIINIDTLQDEKNIIKNNELYQYLAKIYFVTKNDEKIYLVEKILIDLKPHNEEQITKIAKKLEEEGVVVDLSSAMLLDKKNQLYKFTRYQIRK